MTLDEFLAERRRSMRVFSLWQRRALLVCLALAWILVILFVRTVSGPCSVVLLFCGIVDLWAYGPSVWRDP